MHKPGRRGVLPLSAYNDVFRGNRPRAITFHAGTLRPELLAVWSGDRPSGSAAGPSLVRIRSELDGVLSVARAAYVRRRMVPGGHATLQPSVQRHDRQRARDQDFRSSARISADVYMEPVSGFEPLTCRLHEACSQALGPLAAPMPHESATIAPRTLGLSAPPFHDPFHAGPLAQADGLGGSVTLFLTEVNGTRSYVSSAAVRVPRDCFLIKGSSIGRLRFRILGTELLGIVRRHPVAFAAVCRPSSLSWLLTPVTLRPTVNP